MSHSFVQHYVIIRLGRRVGHDTPQYDNGLQSGYVRSTDRSPPLPPQTKTSVSMNRSTNDSDSKHACVCARRGGRACVCVRM